MMSPKDIVHAQITTKNGTLLYHQRWLPKHPLAHELSSTLDNGKPSYEDDEGGWHQLSFTPNGAGHWWRQSVLLEYLVVKITTPNSIS